jgi:hypothetical protein
MTTPPPPLPFDVLPAKNGARILVMHGMLSAQLTREQCREACRLLCDDEPELQSA